jgi:chromosome segregation ATPase
MDEPPADPLLAYARELEEADGTLARTWSRVEELRREVAGLRDHSVEIQLLLERLPDERRAREEAVRSAEEELGRRVAESEAAAAVLLEAERSRAGEEEVAAARRGVVRTRDAAASAERRLDRARNAREQLERDADRAEEETPQIERRAVELAASVGEIPRVSAHASEVPAPGLAATLAWASRAEAALFVARSGLESERERIVRQANELGASALGESLGATSVALVRERLERRP